MTLAVGPGEVEQGLEAEARGDGVALGVRESLEGGARRRCAEVIARPRHGGVVVVAALDEGLAIGRQGLGDVDAHGVEVEAAEARVPHPDVAILGEPGARDVVGTGESRVAVDLIPADDEGRARGGSDLTPVAGVEGDINADAAELGPPSIRFVDVEVPPWEIDPAAAAEIVHDILSQAELVIDVVRGSGEGVGRCAGDVQVQCSREIGHRPHPRALAVPAVLGQGDVQSIEGAADHHLLVTHLLGHRGGYPGDHRHAHRAVRHLARAGHHLHGGGHLHHPRHQERLAAAVEPGGGAHRDIPARLHAQGPGGIQGARAEHADVAALELGRIDGAGAAGIVPVRADPGIGLQVPGGGHGAGHQDLGHRLEQHPRGVRRAAHLAADLKSIGEQLDQGRGIDEGRTGAIVQGCQGAGRGN